MKLQDALGLMQDARVAATRLQELATAEGSTLSTTTVFVMGGLTERYRNESERLSRKVPDLLHELGGSEWRKLTTLMERRRLELGSQYRWPSPPVAPSPVTPGPMAVPRPAGPPGPPAVVTQPATPPATSPPPSLPAQAPGHPAAGPATEHLAPGGPLPARMAPTAWSGDRLAPTPPSRPASVPDPGPDEVSGPSSNGEGRHPEDHR